MLLHIDADPQAALHERLRLPESAYRLVTTPYGPCHVFGLPHHQAALLFEHFPLDLQPVDGLFPAPGPLARKYNNARVHTSGAIAAAAFRLALADGLADPEAICRFHLTLHNAFLPSTSMCEAVATQGHAILEVLPQPVQTDMADIRLSSAAGPLTDALLRLLSLAALADPEAIHWLMPQDYQQLRRDAESWLDASSPALAAEYDAAVQARVSRLYNPAYKTLVEDGDPQLENHLTRLQALENAQATGLDDLLAAEVARSAAASTRVGLLAPASITTAMRLLDIPEVQLIGLFHPAVHVLQQLAGQLNTIGLTHEQAGRLALVPLTTWIWDERLVGFDLLVWEDALQIREADLRDTGLHTLLQHAQPKELLLTASVIDSSAPPASLLSRSAIDTLAKQLSSHYPYTAEIQALSVPESPSAALHLLRLSRITQP